MKAHDPTTELFARAFCQENASELAALFARYPEMKARLNDPIGPFDSPAILNVHSRAMLEVLLDNGADINARSQWWAGGFGLLDLAPPDLAHYAITRGAVVNAHAAARLGLTDRLRELVVADPTLVHARGGDGQTPLHFASTLEVAEFLIGHGADLDARDVDHESTPAQYMVRDRQEIARHLVARGAKTDLLLVTALGDIDRVRQHLTANPEAIRLSVCATDFPMSNPHAGGSIYIWTLGRYKTVLGLAREFGHEAIYRFLKELSPPKLQLIAACESGDAAAVQALLGAHPNLVQSLTEEDQRKMVYAAEENNVKAMRLMLTAGWPVTTRGRHGGTALHWAGFHGNVEMAEALLPYHPPLEWIDDDFKATPMGWATHGSQEGWHRRTGQYAATVEALLKAGAKPPAKLGGTEAVQEVLRRIGKVL